MQDCSSSILVGNISPQPNKVLKRRGQNHAKWSDCHKYAMIQQVFAPQNLLSVLLFSNKTIIYKSKKLLCKLQTF